MEEQCSRFWRWKRTASVQRIFLEDGAITAQPDQVYQANRARTNLTGERWSEGAPVHEQKKLRSSGERHRRDFANGAG